MVRINHEKKRTKVNPKQIFNFQALFWVYDFDYYYRYSDYRDTVLSLMADVSRLKFQGVIPGAPIGLNLNIEQPSIKNCSEELKSKKETEKVLVTSL